MWRKLALINNSHVCSAVTVLQHHEKNPTDFKDTVAAQQRKELLELLRWKQTVLAEKTQQEAAIWSACVYVEITMHCSGSGNWIYCIVYLKSSTVHSQSNKTSNHRKQIQLLEYGH